MTGLDVVARLRRKGMKPCAVMVYLVPWTCRRDPYPLSTQGIVTVDIGAEDSLADIDFRPLVGLHVQLTDLGRNIARHRHAACLIARVEPSLLVVPIANSRGFIVHVRMAGRSPATETIELFDREVVA